MKHLKLFESFESESEDFNSEFNKRRKHDNWSTYNWEGLIKSGDSIRQVIKKGKTVEVLNLLYSYILKNNLENKTISSHLASKTSNNKKILYYYLLYLIDFDRKDVLDEINVNDISGNLTTREKEDLKSWLDNARRVGNKEPFYELIENL